MKTRILQKRRVWCAALFVLLINIAGATKSYAYDFYSVCSTGQILYFNIIDYQNHYVEITCPVAGYSGYSYSGYQQPSGFITIPETVEKNGQTYTVTRIGDFGFISCEGLLGNLVIPSTVTSIGQYAFSGCTGFDGTITIPNSVTTIDQGAFYRCLNLVGTLTLPENLISISSNVFYFCQKIDSVAFPNSLNHIGYRSFFYCTGLPTLYLPESLLDIGNEAFYNCTGLTGNLVIPNNVTTIGRYAFSECSHLNGTLTLGNSVETLDQGAFQGTSFTEVILPNSLKTIGAAAFEYTDIVGELVLPNSVTEIGHCAFWECNRLTSVTIPSSVTNIYDAAFFHCDSLVTVNYYPTSATLITQDTNPNTYKSVFDGCPAMTTINIGPNVVSIPDYFFQRTSWSGTNGYNNISVINSYAPVPPTVGYGTFYNLSTELEMHVPSCSLYDYQSAYQWSNFTNWNADLPCPSVFNGNGGDNLWSNPSNWTVYPSQDDLVLINSVCELDINAEVGDAYVLGKLIIPSGKTFNVTGQFVNTGLADKVIVDEGGQILHCSNGLEATIKKNITNISNTDDGWYLIASPLKDGISPYMVQNLLVSQYDLYKYDEPTHYWKNQKYAENGFTQLTPGEGYLYANSGLVFFDFEEGMAGWTTIDADGNGLNWVHSFNSLAQSGYNYSGQGHNSSDGFIYSETYIDDPINNTGTSYQADNYIVSPQKYSIVNGSMLDFWFAYGNTSYPDFFEVCVATVDNPTSTDFTSVWSVNSGTNNWQLRSVDLSAYSNQNVWIAFHHLDYDKFQIRIDDVSLINAIPIGSEFITEISFAGRVESGNATINIPLSYTETAGGLKGFNLIGNPFVHNITSYGSVNVVSGCFRMNDTHDDLMVSEISAADPLKPAEGFFVKASAEEASITFNPSRGDERTSTTSLRIEVSQNGKALDRLFVKGSNGQALEKFSLNNGQRTKIYAVNNGQELAIVPCDAEELEVNFKATKDGLYTLNFINENMTLTYLHLVDNITGDNVDLLAEPSYTFNARTNDYASRFRLVFNGNSIDENGASTGSDAFAFNNGSEWVINNEGEATLQVIDVLGRQLSSEKIHSEFRFPISTFSTPGVYVLRLVNGDNVRTQKVVVDYF